MTISKLSCWAADSQPTSALLFHLLHPSKRLGHWALVTQSASRPMVFFPLNTDMYLGKVNTECIHVQPVEEAREALAEAGQALVHQLEVHHVGLEIGHGI